MGQANSNELATLRASGVNGTDAVKETDSSESSKDEDNNGSVKYVKNKIDLLIEGCLLAKDPVPCNGKIDDSGSELRTNSSPGNTGSSYLKFSMKPEQLFRTDSIDVEEKDSDSKINMIKQEVKSAQEILCSESVKKECDLEKVGDVDLDSVKCEVKSEVKTEGEASVCKVDRGLVSKETSSKEDTGETQGETTLENKVDLGINCAGSKNTNKGNSFEKAPALTVRDILGDPEIDIKKINCKKQRAITTFQTFIDKVLDHSLQTEIQNSSEKPPTTRVIERCKETENKVELPEHTTASSRPPSNTSKEDTRNGTDREYEKKEPVTFSSKASNSVKEALSTSNMQVLCLKDHIERVLEQSFQRKPGEDDKRVEAFRRNSIPSLNGPPALTSVPSLSSAQDNSFSAQGLVNNMMNQSLQINKMLSSPKARTQEPNLMSAEHSFRVEPSHRPILRPSDNHDQYTGDSGPRNGDIHGYVAAPVRQAWHPSEQYQREQTVPGLSPQHKHGYPQTSPSPKGLLSLSHSRFDPRDPRGDYHHARGVPTLKPSPSVAHHQRSPEMRIPSSSQVSHLQVTHRLPSPVTFRSQTSPHYGQHYPLPKHSPHSASVHAQLHPPGHNTVQGPPSPGNREHSSQNIHLRDCRCLACIPQNRSTSVQKGELSVQEQHYYSRQNRSPNVPHGPPVGSHVNPPHPNESAPVMMRPSFSAVPPGYGQIIPMPKLLPTNPPISSPKEANHQLGRGGTEEFPHGHRTYYDERTPRAYPGDYQQQSKSPPISAARYSNHVRDQRSPQGPYHKNDCGPYPSRPSSLPPQEGRIVGYSPDGYVVSGAPVPQRVVGSLIEIPGHEDDDDCTSGPGEAPLDLSCKPSLSAGRQRTPSCGSSHSSLAPQIEIKRDGTLSNPINTFIKHLESSVDKYFPEVKVGPNSDQNRAHLSAPQRSVQFVTNSDSRSHNTQPGVSPHPNNSPQLRNVPGSPMNYNSGSSGAGNMSVPYQGAMPRSQQQVGSENVAPSSWIIPPRQAQSEESPEVNHSDPNSNKKRNSVSKHEPIQNIIGNHNQNDILYLICRLCSQTYGSPYGFRKHFRNQHGFEPHADHTIVVTISAVQNARQAPPVQPTGQVIPGAPTQQQMPRISQNFMPQEPRLQSRAMTDLSSDVVVSTERRRHNSGDSRSSDNSETNKSLGKDRTSADENEETKFLECPECGKTFQLNDFGSYKRHCRQHNHVKINGPYSCSDCHLTFQEAHLLKDHLSSHFPATNGIIQGDSLSKALFSAPAEKRYSDIAADQVGIERSSSQKDDEPPKLSPQMALGGTSQQTLVNITNPSSKNKREIEKELDRRSPNKNQTDFNTTVISTQNVTREAAESMTVSAYPDSSSDVKKVTAVSQEEKIDDLEEGSMSESADTGYSSSIGSNSALAIEEKVIDVQSEKSSSANFLRQKSSDSAGDASDDKNKEEQDFASFYKHKKFCSRKRESSISSSEGPSLPKKRNKAASSEVTQSPVPSKSPNVLTRSSESEMSTLDSDLKEQQKGVKDVSDYMIEKGESDDSQDSSKLQKNLKCASGNSKSEARHNLPFVWDRVTRSKVGNTNKS